MERAQIEVDTSRSKEALATYQEARDQADLYLKASGEQSNFQELRVRIDHQMSRLLETLGQFEKAIELSTTSIDTLTKLIAETPLLHQYQQKLAMSYGQRAMIFTRIRKHKEAEADIRMELKLMDQLVAMNPTYVNKRELARAQGHLGDHYLFQRNHKECEKQYREAARIYAELIPLQPGDTEVRLWLSNMHMSLGNVLLGQMRFKDAIIEYEAAHDGFEKLVELCPDITINRVLLGGACCNLGNSNTNLGHLKEASEWLEQGVKALKKALEQEPSHSLAQTFLRNTLFGSTELALKQGNVTRAVEMVNEACLLPVLEYEKPLIQRMTGGVQDRLLAAAKTEAEAGQWKTLLEHAELLNRSKGVTNRRIKEMLKLCCTAMQAGQSATFTAIATSMVKRLKESKYFEDADYLKEFQTEAVFAPVRNLEAVKAIMK